MIKSYLKTHPNSTSQDYLKTIKYPYSNTQTIQQQPQKKNIKHPHYSHTQLIFATPAEIQAQTIPNTLFSSRRSQKNILPQAEISTPQKKNSALKKNLTKSLILEPPFHPQQQKNNNNLSFIIKQPYYQLIQTNYNPNKLYNHNIKKTANNVLQEPTKQKSSITNSVYLKDQQKLKNKPPPYFQYVLNYSYRSRKGSNILDPNKPNQDVPVILPNINNQTFLHYFGVCDGHGPSGHFVSSYVKKNLKSQLSMIKNDQQNPKHKIMEAFKAISNRMPLQLNANLQVSGSTSVGIYLNHNKLYCCNIGDSKAVLGSCDASKKWRHIDLSIEHKPQNPQEAARILRSGGRIQSYKDQKGQQVGPQRIWLRNEDSPGLAMTRCFGDEIASRIGVISVPEILQFCLCDKDKIVVIATDGVWQFLSSEEVVEIVSPYYQSGNIQQACNVLMDRAVKLWRDDNSQSVDDITFVVLFVNY